MAKTIRRRDVPGDVVISSDLHPVLQRVYAARGVRSSRELESHFDFLHAYAGLRGIDHAAQLLAYAVVHNQRIMVLGDFDADGATSCATALRALRGMGAAHVSFLVPNRFAFGYGLTPEIVAVAQQQQPDLLMTVDNGIASIEGVAAAKAAGMRVVITDHHLPGAQLPAADAIVNPNQAGDDFPSKCLAGVGVVFYVMIALRAVLREQGWFKGLAQGEPNLATLLDLVALGTIADVVPLDHCNRILVAQGLARIRRGQCCPGILALLDIAGRDRQRLSASDLAFAVAPRLNAAGRLDDMSLGISCLLSDDYVQARGIAARLELLNVERREIEAGMREEAVRQAEVHGAADTEGTMARGLCVYDPAWHQGVIGIIAGRMKDRLHRPVIAFAPSGEGELKGSARSIPGVHVRDVLDHVATSHPGLLTRFGGHAMAAGLTLPETHLPDFRVAFTRALDELAAAELFEQVVLSDGELTAGDLNLEVAQTLRDGGPWGQGFPEPVFDGLFDVVSQRVVGERHLKLFLRPEGARDGMDAILFNADQHADVTVNQRMHLAYRLDVNEFRGRRSAQLMVEHWLPVG